MEEFGNWFLINGRHRSLPRLCELKQNWGEWELFHMIINQDIRDERELVLSLNSSPETLRYLCGRWQIMSHQSRLTGAKDILLAWVFEAHSAPISIAAVSPLIRHESWQICHESGLKHNTGLLWWIRCMISSDTSIVCSPECVSVWTSPRSEVITPHSHAIKPYQIVILLKRIKIIMIWGVNWVYGVFGIMSGIYWQGYELICWKCVDFTSVGATLSVNVGLIKYVWR